MEEHRDHNIFLGLRDSSQHRAFQHWFDPSHYRWHPVVLERWKVSLFVVHRQNYWKEILLNHAQREEEQICTGRWSNTRLGWRIIQLSWESQTSACSFSYLNQSSSLGNWEKKRESSTYSTKNNCVHCAVMQWGRAEGQGEQRGGRNSSDWT